MMILNTKVILVITISVTLAEAWDYPWSRPKVGRRENVVDSKDLEELLERGYKRCAAISSSDMETCIDSISAELIDKQGSVLGQLTKILHLDHVKLSKAKVSPPASRFRGGSQHQGLGLLLDTATNEPNIVHQERKLGELGLQRIIDIGRIHEENERSGMLKMLEEAQSLTKVQLDKLEQSSPTVRGASKYFSMSNVLCLADKFLYLKNEISKSKGHFKDPFGRVLLMMNLKNIFDQVMKISKTIKTGSCSGPSTGTLDRLMKSTIEGAFKRLVQLMIVRFFGSEAEDDQDMATEVCYRMSYFLIANLLGI